MSTLPSSTWSFAALLAWATETLPHATIEEDNDGQLVIYTNYRVIGTDPDTDQIADMETL